MADVMRQCPRCRQTFAGPDVTVDEALMDHMAKRHAAVLQTQGDADSEEAAHIQIFKARRK